MEHTISGLDSNALGNIPETIDAGSIDSIIETNEDAKAGKEAMSMRESTGPLDLNSANSPESPNSAQRMEEDGSLIPASPNSSGKEEVAQWLMTLNLEYLIDTFYKQGYDDINVIRELNEQDLDALGIDKTGVRKKLLLYVKKLRNRNKTDDVLEEEDDGSLETVSGDGSEPSLADSQLGGNITGRKRSLGSSLDSSREKKKRKKKRRSPYRCSKCCMFKVQSINKHNSHKCDEKLVGHTFENCPTQNLRAHPEEQESRRKQKASDRKKKEKRTKKPKPEGMTSVSPVKGVVATGNSGNTMGVEGGVADDKVDINGLSNVDWDTFRERELRKMSQSPYAGLFNGPQRTQGMLMIVQKYYDLKNKVEELKSKKKRVDYVDTADLSSLVDPVEGSIEVINSSLEDHQSVGGNEGDQGYSQTHGTVPGVVGGGHSNLPLLVSGEQGHHSEMDTDHQHELMNHVGQVLSSTLANQHSHQHAHHTGTVLEDKEDRITG